MRFRPCLAAMVLFLCLTLGACGSTAVLPETTKAPQTQTTTTTQEIRAVWISYADLTLPEENRTQEAFRALAKEMTDRIRDGKMNTIFLHVRPNSDALYHSTLFPYSACITGTEGVDPGYDALAIFCEYADAAGLSVHAWINPFRIGSALTSDERSDKNPAMQILRDDDTDNDSRVVRVHDTLYYDPADKENQDLVLNGVRELLRNYPIDGIHIDDYFYPTTEPFVDRKEYDAYLAQSGTLERGEWRRAQISAFVGRLFTCVKSFGSEKIFSISPALNIEHDRDTLYADVARWTAYGGYCDWMIPQVYVGFAHETQPFEDTVAQWTSLRRSPDVQLLFGLAAYKCGQSDPYAGSGSDEWIESKDILSRQLRLLRGLQDYSGFALFSYMYAFGGKMSDNSILEMNSVISML